jgi:hypothetical protein
MRRRCGSLERGPRTADLGNKMITAEYAEVAEEGLYVGAIGAVLAASLFPTKHRKSKSPLLAQKNAREMGHPVVILSFALGRTVNLAI